MKAEGRRGNTVTGCFCSRSYEWGAAAIVDLRGPQFKLAGHIWPVGCYLDSPALSACTLPSPL